MEIRCVEKFAFQNLAKDAGIDAYSSPTETSAYKSMKTKIPFVARETIFYIGYKWYRIWQTS